MFLTSRLLLASALPEKKIIGGKTPATIQTNKEDKGVMFGRPGDKFVTAAKLNVLITAVLSV